MVSLHPRRFGAVRLGLPYVGGPPRDLLPQHARQRDDGLPGRTSGRHGPDQRGLCAPGHGLQKNTWTSSAISREPKTILMGINSSPGSERPRRRVSIAERAADGKRSAPPRPSGATASPTTSSPSPCAGICASVCPMWIVWSCWPNAVCKRRRPYGQGADVPARTAGYRAGGGTHHRQGGATGDRARPPAPPDDTRRRTHPLTANSLRRSAEPNSTASCNFTPTPLLKSYCGSGAPAGVEGVGLLSPLTRVAPALRCHGAHSSITPSSASTAPPAK